MPSSSAVARPCAGTGAFLCAVASLAAVAGCGSPSRLPPTVHIRTAAPIATQTIAPTSPDWSGPVPVASLIRAAEDSHPTRDAIIAARAAAAAQVQQASSWDNPELSLHLGRTRPRVDDLTQDHPYGGSLSQRLRWWGTRHASIAAAHAQQQATEAEAHATLLGLRAEVRRAAIAYAMAIEIAELAAADARLATELVAMVEARLAAGDVDRSSVARARLEAATATLQSDARTRTVATTLAVLRTWCGTTLPEGLIIADALDGLGDAPGLPPSVEQHPQLRTLHDLVAASAAQVEAERAKQMPDLTVGIFADREADQDTYGLTVGFELPLWHRNDAAIATAEAAHAQARAAARSERLRLTRDLVEAFGAAQTALAEAAALRKQAMPAAEEAVHLRMTAFQAGDAGLSDLLEARRAANLVRSAVLDARQRAALALVDLDLALGEPLPAAVPPHASRP